MCITSETCRANSVIKTALNNLHQAGPNKTRWYLSTPRSGLDRVGRRRQGRGDAAVTATAEGILGPGDSSVLSVRCVS
jgi:hypothetical protein